MFDTVQTMAAWRTSLAWSAPQSLFIKKGGGGFYEPISVTDWSITMIIRTLLAAAIAATTLLTATGCAVSRGQETVGAYIDDAGITTTVKTRLLEDKRVAGTSISVETLNGTVMLSGFAKNTEEKNVAENIARQVNGVRSVKNEIAIRP